MESLTSEAQAQPKWTFSLLIIVLATSIPFVVTGVDPLLLSLNLPAITQDLEIPSDLVGFTGSVATLVMAAAVLGVGNLGDLYGYKRLLIYGLIGNIVFEGLTAFSPSYQFFILLRFLDGLALTALLGLSLALLTASAPANIRSRAIGFFLPFTGSSRALCRSSAAWWSVTSAGAQRFLLSGALGSRYHPDFPGCARRVRAQPGEHARCRGHLAVRDLSPWLRLRHRSDTERAYRSRDLDPPRYRCSRPPRFRAMGESAAGAGTGTDVVLGACVRRRDFG
jgi:MFS family permease